MAAVLVDTAAASVNAAKKASRRRQRRLRGRSSVILTVVFWMLLAYFMLPLAWLVVNSTKTNSDLFATFGLAFSDTFALFDNIGQLIEHRGSHNGVHCQPPLDR